MYTANIYVDQDLKHVQFREGFRLQRVLGGGGGGGC